jgi:hypothetical protein
MLTESDLEKALREMQKALLDTTLESQPKDPLPDATGLSVAPTPQSSSQFPNSELCGADNGPGPLDPTKPIIFTLGIQLAMYPDGRVFIQKSFPLCAPKNKTPTVKFKVPDRKLETRQEEDEEL